jgi:hypothetical protein
MTMLSNSWSRMTEPSGYINGSDTLRRLMKLQDTEANIVKISPKDHTLNNGVDYCCVVVEYKDGTNYSLHAYGKEARELHEEATIMETRPIMLSSPQCSPLNKRIEMMLRMIWEA